MVFWGTYENLQTGLSRDVEINKKNGTCMEKSLESGFLEKRLHVLPLTRKMVQNICY